MRGHASEPTPLLEIENAAKERAKAISVDPSSADGVAQIRRLVEAEVLQWSEDYRRGTRPFDLADRRLVCERAVRNLVGYGPLEALMSDDDVWEIMINSPDAVFVRRHSGPSGYHDEVFHDDEHVLRTITKIVDDSAGAHRKLDPADGLQDAQLDNGARLHVVHGDIGRSGHMLVNIRKFTGLPLRSLNELVARQMFDWKVAEFLRCAMKARLSVVFAGSPGSGKTTLLSCCASELDPSLRVVVAEEVFETDIDLPNVAHMQTRPARADRPAVDLRRLVAGFLRMAPDVAILGEVRDKEALPLLLTLSSGVKGYTTIHAGSARQALGRLRFLAQLSEAARDLPLPALNNLVAESVDLVVQCRRDSDAVRVDEIVAVEDPVSANSSSFTLTELFLRAEPGEPLTWTGNLPGRISRLFQVVGLDALTVLGDVRPGRARLATSAAAAEGR